MKKTLLAILTVLGMCLHAPAAPEKPAPAKPAPSKPAATPKAPDKTAPEAKPDEVSAADKALLAHGEKGAATLSAAQKKQLLDLVNTGDDTALQTIPGVGEAKAANIKAKRPVKTVADIIMVDGIGESTYDGIIKWVKGGMKSEATAAPATKPETKKPDTKKPAPTKKPA